MPLDKLLKEHTLEEISTKTNIAKNNLENLINKEFDKLIRIKALGFIAIIEREYQLDLETLRSEVLSYYNEHTAERNFKINTPIVDEPEGKSKSFLFFILLLFIGVSWYFVKQFDKKDLRSYLPFKFGDVTTLTSLKKEDVVANLSIENVEVNVTSPLEIVEEKNNTIEDNTSIAVLLSKPLTPVIEENETIDESNATEEVTSVGSDEVKTQEAEAESNMTEPEAIVEEKTVTILPANRLWFGIIEKETKKRDQFSVAKPYKLDVTDKSWLLATSSASFYLIVEGEKSYHKGGKSQYFEINKEGFVSLTKEEYRRKGGWRQW